MGQDFYDSSATARQIFDLLEQSRPGTIQQCFHGPKEALSTTVNTQPCLFTVDYAIAKAVEETGISIDAVAGFSLGEIPALAFAGVLELPQAFQLVCYRAQAMQHAAEVNPGSMHAILKLSADVITKMAEAYSDVFPVNYNSPQQTVVSGKPEQLTDFAAKVKEAGGRAVPLAVSGAFHSPYMDEAAQALSTYGTKLEIQPGRCPVYANYTAQPYTVDTARQLIANQVNHPVQWVKTIQQMMTDGVDCFIEVGPGKTLSGLVKKITADAQVYKVENIADLDVLRQALCK